MLARRVAVLGAFLVAIAVAGCNGLFGIEAGVFDRPADAGTSSDATTSPREDDARVVPEEEVDAAPATPDPPAPDAGPCTDTEKNPRHCGTCGHDCGPGTCVASVCQPGTLVTDADGPTTFVVTKDHVIYQTKNALIRRVPIFGGAPATLFKGSDPDTLGANLVVLGSHFYFSDRSFGTVLRCPIVGACTPGTVMSMQGPDLLVALNGNLYVADGPLGSRIVRCKSPPCGTAEPFASNETNIARLAAAEDTIIWARETLTGTVTVRAQPTGIGPAFTLSIESAVGAVGSLVGHGRRAYVEIDGELLSYSIDNPPDRRLETRIGHTTTLSILRPDFWYANSATGTIFRRPIGAAAATPSTTEHQNIPGGVSALVADAGGIYWISGNNIVRHVR